MWNTYPASPHHFRMATKLRNPAMFCVGSHHAGTSPPSSPPSAASSAAPSAAAASPVLPLLAAYRIPPSLATNNTSLFLHCVQSYWFALRANQYPILIGRIFFSFHPSNNSQVLIPDPWIAFWGDAMPFKGPSNSPHALLPELQGYKDRLALSEESRGQRTLPKTDTDLDCRISKNTLFHTDPLY